MSSDNQPCTKPYHCNCRKEGNTTYHTFDCPVFGDEIKTTDNVGYFCTCITPETCDICTNTKVSAEAIKRKTFKRSPNAGCTKCKGNHRTDDCEYFTELKAYTRVRERLATEHMYDAPQTNSKLLDVGSGETLSGGWIARRIKGEYKKHPTQDWARLAEYKILGTLNWKMKELEETGWCPHCSEKMDLHTHYCESCDERVAIPYELDLEELKEFINTPQTKPLKAQREGKRPDEVSVMATAQDKAGETLKIEKILKYIKRQNFNGSYGMLKKNIVNYIKEIKEEEQ